MSMTAVEISDIRARAGLSQADLARKLGVSTHTVQNWEQGLRKPGGPAILMLEVIRDAGRGDTDTSQPKRKGRKS
jgi:putative transcriptional regulator